MLTLDTHVDIRWPDPPDPLAEGPMRVDFPKMQRGGLRAAGPLEVHEPLGEGGMGGTDAGDVQRHAADLNWRCRAAFAMMGIRTPPAPELQQTGRRSAGHETGEPALSAGIAGRPLIPALFRLQHICKWNPLTLSDS